MEKNQIFIKTGTKYKKMTRELLEESNLAELIGDKYQTQPGIPIRSGKWRNNTSGNRGGNPGISERKRFQKQYDPRGFLGRRPYCRCIRSVRLPAAL